MCKMYIYNYLPFYLSTSSLFFYVCYGVVLPLWCRCTSFVIYESTYVCLWFGFCVCIDSVSTKHKDTFSQSVCPKTLYSVLKPNEWLRLAQRTKRGYTGTVKKK